MSESASGAPKNSERCIPLVKLFLYHYIGQVDLKTRTNWGETAITLACEAGHKYIVQLLVNHPEIDVSTKINGITPFMMACKKGHTDVVQVILDHSNRTIDLNAKRRDGMTALMLACQNGQSNIVQLLLDYHSVRNIELNARSNSGKTAFGYAPEYHEVVDLLLKYPDLKV